MIWLGLFLASIVFVSIRGYRKVIYYGEEHHAIESAYLLFLISALTLFTRGPQAICLPYVMILPPGAEPWYVAHEAAHAMQYLGAGPLRFLTDYIFDRDMRYQLECVAIAEELRVRLRFCTDDAQTTAAWEVCTNYAMTYSNGRERSEVENDLAQCLVWGPGAHA